jgi:hypothetical protein
VPSASASPSLLRVERLLSAEQIGLARIVVTFGRDGFIVTAYLGVVACLKLQRKLHECIGAVGSRFIGDGDLVRLFSAEFVRHRLNLRSRLGCGSSCPR